MAGTAQFTVADVCSVLGVRKHEVRALLRLPPYCKARVSARTARKFTPSELVYFVLVAQVHLKFGISPRAISRSSAALHDLVTSDLRSEKVILVDVQQGTAAYLSASAPSQSGVVLPVAPAIEHVQNYLLGELLPAGSGSRNVVRLDRRTKA